MIYSSQNLTVPRMPSITEASDASSPEAVERYGAVQLLESTSGRGGTLVMEPLRNDTPEEFADEAPRKERTRSRTWGETGVLL